MPFNSVDWGSFVRRTPHAVDRHDMAFLFMHIGALAQVHIYMQG
jgi:hypothetical protein